MYIIHNLDRHTRVNVYYAKELVTTEKQQQHKFLLNHLYTWATWGDDIFSFAENHAFEYVYEPDCK